MKSFKKLLIVSAIAFASVGANAEVIKTDYAASGDNQVATDLETGIEWLSLTQTAGLSLNDVEELLATEYVGWSLASRNEVNVLFSHLTGYDFVEPETYTFGGYNGNTKASAYNIFDKLGWLSGTSTHGLYRDVDGTIMMSGVYVKNSSNTLNYMFDDHTAAAYTEDYSSTDHSWMLRSDGGTSFGSLENPDININNAVAQSSSVPVTTSAALLGLGLLGFNRRKV